MPNPDSTPTPTTRTRTRWSDDEKKALVELRERFHDMKMWERAKTDEDRWDVLAVALSAQAGRILTGSAAKSQYERLSIEDHGGLSCRKAHRGQNHMEWRDAGSVWPPISVVAPVQGAAVVHAGAVMDRIDRLDAVIGKLQASVDHLLAVLLAREAHQEREVGRRDTALTTIYQMQVDMLTRLGGGQEDETN